MLYDFDKQDFKFKEDESMILNSFTQYIHSMIESFHNFKSPEYLSV